MPEKSNWKTRNLEWLIKQVKAFGVVAGITITTVGGGMWYVGENYLEAKVHEIIEAEHSSKSFREVLGEKMDIPEDEVAIRLVEKLNLIDSLTSHVGQFESKYVPHLDFQLRISPMYRYLDEDGIQWWMGPDRRSHGVLFDNGQAWCVYSNQKTVIGNSY